MTLREQAARDYHVKLVGPVKRKVTREPRTGSIFDREALTIDWERPTLTCPAGNGSGNWTPPPSLAPLPACPTNSTNCRPRREPNRLPRPG
jgi:hypothetical protein